ncbi:MAG: arginine deiminase family protein [Malacoplasma sp.]
MLKFKNIIVKTPCQNMINGISSANLGKVDYKNALKQHKNYIDTLKKIKLNVKVMPLDEHYPDSCFVEDVLVATDKFAILTNPGAKARNGEKGKMAVFFARNFKLPVHYIEYPGSLDGGDVMMVGNKFYIGKSERTNMEGIKQFEQIVSQYKSTVIPVEMKEMLHLKTGLSYLEHNNLLIYGEFVKNPLFKSFNQIVIDKDESYAANSIWLNDVVIVPAGYPKTKAAIEALGIYKVVTCDTSEFRKLDGGLSCLSNRF